MNFANYTDLAARDRPDATAFSDPGREVTFAEFAGETNVAIALRPDLKPSKRAVNDPRNGRVPLRPHE